MQESAVLMGSSADAQGFILPGESEQRDESSQDPARAGAEASSRKVNARELL
jgi:hypothetical protein